MKPLGLQISFFFSMSLLLLLLLSSISSHSRTSFLGQATAMSPYVSAQLRHAFRDAMRHSHQSPLSAQLIRENQTALIQGPSSARRNDDNVQSYDDSNRRNSISNTRKRKPPRGLGKSHRTTKPGSEDSSVAPKRIDEMNGLHQGKWVSLRCKHLVPVKGGTEDYCVCAPFERCIGFSCVHLSAPKLVCNGQPRAAFHPRCKNCRCSTLYDPKPQLPMLRAGQSLNCDHLHPGFCGPKIIIAGADKCGTNALYAHIRQALPDILYTIPMKGRQYSCIKRGFSGEINWDWVNQPLTIPANQLEYSRYLYRTDWNTSVALDKSTTYFSMAETGVKNLHLAFPHSKVLALICNPIKRLWGRMNQNNKYASQARSECPLYNPGWDQHVLKQAQMIVAKFRHGPSSFSVKECDALLASYGKVGGAIARLREWPCNFCRALATSIYSPHVRNWQRIHGENNFLVIKTDDLLADPIGMTKSVLKFVGLAPQTEVADIGLVNVNNGSNVENFVDPSISSSFKEFTAILRPFFLREIQELELLMAPTSFEDWRASIGA